MISLDTCSPLHQDYGVTNYTDTRAFAGFSLKLINLGEESVLFISKVIRPKYSAAEEKMTFYLSFYQSWTKFWIISETNLLNLQFFDSFIREK
jgi:hypothetical protein